MERVDLSRNPRVATLLEMLRKLSVAPTPREVLLAFATHYWPLKPIDLLLSISTRNTPPGHYRLTRRINVADVLAGRQAMDPQDVWRPHAQLPVHSGGLLGDLIAEPTPTLLRHMKVDNDPVLGDALKGMGSGLALPLFDAGEVKYWTFQFRRDPDGFTPADIEQAFMISNFVSGTNNKLVLLDEVRKLNGALTRQFEEVARVQRSLLPKVLPEIPGLTIATSYLTSDEAGGDYYDFFRFKDDRWGVLIADVSGHGAAAATIMAMLHGILHAYEAPAITPDAVMRYVNRKLVEAGLDGSFVTAFFGIYDPRDGRFTYSRSGHNPPRLKKGRAGAVLEINGAGGLPLGVFEPYEITSETIRFEPGDTLILYTDGITEAFNGRREMFGLPGLDAALEGCSGQPDCVVDSVHAALFEHTGGSRTRADDQTLVAMQYVGAVPRIEVTGTGRGAAARATSGSAA